MRRRRRTHSDAVLYVVKDTTGMCWEIRTDAAPEAPVVQRIAWRLVYDDTEVEALSDKSYRTQLKERIRACLTVEPLNYDEEDALFARYPSLPKHPLYFADESRWTRVVDDEEVDDEPTVPPPHPRNTQAPRGAPSKRRTLSADRKIEL